MILRNDIEVGRQRAVVLDHRRARIEMFNHNGDSFEQLAVRSEHIGVDPLLNHGLGRQDDSLRQLLDGDRQPHALTWPEEPGVIDDAVIAGCLAQDLVHERNVKFLDAAESIDGAFEVANLQVIARQRCAVRRFKCRRHRPFLLHRAQDQRRVTLERLTGNVEYGMQGKIDQFVSRLNQLAGEDVNLLDRVNMVFHFDVGGLFVHESGGHDARCGATLQFQQSLRVRRRNLAAGDAHGEFPNQNLRVNNRADLLGSQPAHEQFLRLDELLRFEPAALVLLLNLVLLGERTAFDERRDAFEFDVDQFDVLQGA